MWTQLAKKIYQKPWWEIMLMYVSMVVLTVGLGWAQTFIAWLGGFVLFIVALAFMYLPTEWLRYHGADLSQYGIATGSITQSWKSALWIALLVLIPYSFGYHYWQVWQGRDLTWDQTALSKWPEELEGAPTVRRIVPGDIRWYTQRTHMYWRWHLKPNEKFLKLQLTMDESAHIKWIGRSRGIRIQVESNHVTIIAPPKGYLIAKTNTQHAQLQAWANHKQLALDRIKVGPFMQRYDQSTMQRGYLWILYTLLIQLFLVALPEEIFYRGYMQTRLDQLVGRDQMWWGSAFNFKSALVCSALFAVAHFATIPSPTRLAVFFPSLLFGWMRRAYGNTLTPAIFHALCNVWVQVLWGFYQGGLV